MADILVLESTYPPPLDGAVLAQGTEQALEPYVRCASRVEITGGERGA